jgi:hypothetical protein
VQADPASLRTADGLIDSENTGLINRPVQNKKQLFETLMRTGKLLFFDRHRSNQKATSKNSGAMFRFRKLHNAPKNVMLFIKINLTNGV